jgi:hypothetical protein
MNMESEQLGSFGTSLAKMLSRRAIMVIQFVKQYTWLTEGGETSRNCCNKLLN